MRKYIAIVVLVVVLMALFTGCGCSKNASGEVRNPMTNGVPHVFSVRQPLFLYPVGNDLGMQICGGYLGLAAFLLARKNILVYNGKTNDKEAALW